VICGISSLIQSPFDCCIMLAEGQVRSICSSCFHWKHSRFLSETFLHDTRNNRDNRVSPLTTDHPQRASNVTRAKSSGSLSLSLSLSLARALSLSCVHRGAFTLITHLGFMAPGMHTRMFARIIGRAVRCAPVPWEQSSCTRERERERESRLKFNLPSPLRAQPITPIRIDATAIQESAVKIAGDRVATRFVRSLWRARLLKIDNVRQYCTRRLFSINPSLLSFHRELLRHFSTRCDWRPSNNGRQVKWTEIYLTIQSR